MSFFFLLRVLLEPDSIWSESTQVPWVWASSERVSWPTPWSGASQLQVRFEPHSFIRSWVVLWNLLAIRLCKLRMQTVGPRAKYVQSTNFKRPRTQPLNKEQHCFDLIGWVSIYNNCGHCVTSLYPLYLLYLYSVFTITKLQLCAAC